MKRRQRRSRAPSPLISRARHGTSRTREPPDHLAVELDLMARLIAAHHPDRSVLLARLAAWVPTFCDLCIARDATGFWAGAAEVLLSVLAHETRDVADPRSPIN